MVGRAICFVWLAAILAGLPASQVFAKELADYQVGDTVEADIVAPEKFLVLDAQATDARRRRESQNLPMVARYYPEVAFEAEAAMRNSFINARSNFLALVQTQLHRPMPDPKATDEFLQQAVEMPGLDRSFPLTPELAVLWVRGQSDESFLNSLAAQLREAMHQYIFPSPVPEGWRTGNAARLIALANGDVLPTPQLVNEKGFTVLRTNIISFTKARTDFRAGFAPEDRGWANFAVQFLKENCAPDLKLTEAVRTDRIAAIQMGDTYQAGQVIAKRGEVVNAKILAVFSRVEELRVSKPAPQSPQPVVAAPVAVVPVKPDNHWLWFALGGVSIVAALALGVAWKLGRRPAISLLPARTNPVDVILAGSPTVGASRDFRDLVAPHLARLLTNRFVRKLIAQRADLIVMQQQVASEIEELERRLEQIHAPLQERLQAYEVRISELEKQLAEKTEQNRELIKAKIEGVKQQMENERAKSRVKFN